MGAQSKFKVFIRTTATLELNVMAKDSKEAEAIAAKKLDMVGIKHGKAILSIEIVEDKINDG